MAEQIPDAGGPEAAFAHHERRSFGEGDIAAFWTGDHWLIGTIDAIDLSVDSPHFGGAVVGVWDDMYTVAFDKVIAMRADDLVDGGRRLVGTTYPDKERLQAAVIGWLTPDARSTLRGDGT